MKHELITLVETIYRETGDFCTIELTPQIGSQANIRTYISSRESKSTFSANGEPNFKYWDTVEEAVTYLKTYLKEYSND